LAPAFLFMDFAARTSSVLTQTFRRCNRIDVLA
jgi:hypothetical protein